MKAAIDRSPADIKIEEMGEYVAKLEKQLSTIAKNSEVLVKRWKDASAAASELALSLIGFESSDAESKSTEASKVCRCSVVFPSLPMINHDDFTVGNRRRASFKCVLIAQRC